MRWTWTVPLAVLCALVAAGCGSSSHKTAASTPTRTPASTTSATSATTSTATASSTTAAPTTTTAPVQSDICRAADLRLSFIGGQAATGHGLLGFALRNVGTSSCHSVGYPGIQFLDKSGAPLPTTPTHTTHDFFGAAPLRALTVSPGETVSFRIGVTHFGPNGSDTGCTTASGLQVIPPNDTATLRVTIGNGGEYQCGTATVSPLQPGTSAYP